MRQIGIIPDEKAARRFTDYLLTQGISTRLDPSDDGWLIWVHQEDLIPVAREALQAFEQNARDPRFEKAGAEAEAIRRRNAVLDKSHQKNTIDLRGRLGNPLLGGGGKITRGLTIACIAVFVANWLRIDFGGRSLYGWLEFSTWYIDGEGRIESDGLASILSGQVWRLITPVFLHFGIIHLVFNMMMLNQLGRRIEWRRGSTVYIGLLVFTALVSNFAQYAFPDAFTIPAYRVDAHGFGGMSGVIYGLFGYAWIRGRQDPSSGLYLSNDTIIILLGWLVVCAFNLVGPIANTAHVAGLVAGVAYGLTEIESQRWSR